jgi:CRISPR-associated endonuclease Cas1
MTIDKIADGDLDGTLEKSILDQTADQDDAEWADRSAYWQKQATWRPRARKQKRKVRSPLVLGGHGVRLHIDGGSLLVHNGFTHYPQKREEWRFFPGHPDLPSRIVVVDGNGALTFDVLEFLSTQQIPLIQINWRGEAITVAGGTGYAADSEITRAQRETQIDDDRRMAICRWLVTDKFGASCDTLAQVVEASPARERALQEVAASLREITTRPPQTLDALRGIEGRVALAYFTAWRSMPLLWKGLNRRPIPEEWHRIGPRVPPNTKRNRNAMHPLNAMLNYGLAVLESQVRMAVVAAGLDPTIGYFHGRYGGKQTLVLDLMEPMRPLVDRAVLGFSQAHTFSPGDLTLRDDGICRLNPELARNIVSLVSKRVTASKAVDEILSLLPLRAAFAGGVTDAEVSTRHVRHRPGNGGRRAGR